MRTTRRTFMAAAGVAALWPTLRVRGAHDDIRVAILGVRSKGEHHIRQFSAVPGVRVVALCDPDRAILAERAAAAGIPTDRTFTDMRRVFDDPAVDAVVIVTPNQWHALATIWACQAGKDVYVEKPCSHTIWEGRQMIAAARKYGRLVQVGTQRRSDKHLRQAFEQIRGGELGKILRVRVLHYSRRDSIGTLAAPQAPPASVDYNLWAGPAPMSPITRPQFHYDWHWFWETGNGELGNNGPHAMDLARWVLGYDRLAPRITSIGGRFVWDDSGQTPNTHLVYYDYEPAPIIAEIRNLPDKTGSKSADAYKGLRTGIIVECEGGYFAGMDGGALYDHDGRQIRKIGGDGGRHHPRTFIEAVRSRKVSDLTCDITEGHLSTALCHQGNVSHRLGATSGIIQHERRGFSVQGDAYDRMIEHLRANGVDIASAKLTYGPSLTFDPAAERFTGEHADAANAQLKGPYRDPFIVPELA